MATGYEIGGLILNIVMAALLTQLGLVVWRRRPTGPARLAGTGFAGWWIMLGLLQISALIDLIVTRTVGWTIPGYTTYVQALLLLISVGFAGLLYYMVYLFTGRARAWIPVTIGYVAMFIVLLHWFNAADIIALNQGEFASEPVYKRDLADGPLSTVIGLILLVPVFMAAIGYLSLYFKVQERSQRFRIATIGGAFTFWFGSSIIVGQATDWNNTEWWPLVSSLITLLAAAGVYATFQPPRWMRKALHIHGFGEHAD